MISETRTGSMIHLMTLVIATLSTVAVDLAIAAPGASPSAVLAWACALSIAPMWLASFWIGRRRPRPESARRFPISRQIEFVALLLLMILPMIFHPLMAGWVDHGLPLEILLMAALRNLGLGLAALAHRPRMARLAALVSLFVVMVASAMSNRFIVLVIVGVYAVAGVLWLMLSYWEGLVRSMAIGPRSRPPALAMLAWASVFAVVVVGAVAVGPTRSASVLAEWVSSSGGTGETEPDAQSGVNDGDNEVSASKDPKSIGFTESEVYLESDRPSLYDSFSDQYGEPIKPKNKQERMIGLKPRENQAKDHPTENLHAGRTFATPRKPPTRQARPGLGRQAKALVYVKGDTPLHLGLTTYDHFDGVNWEEESDCRRHCPLELVSKTGAWLRIDWPTARPFAGSTHHQIKIGTLDSSTLPIPSHTTRLRVGSVNRPDFFGWAQTGMIRMVDRTIPAGTVIDTESQIVDPDRLRSLTFEAPVHSINEPYLGVPDSLDPKVAALVHSWIKGTSRGWSQVEAVVAGVRGHCLHDREATVPGNLDDVVGRFLLGSRCGPDHQFASASAVSLRLLGYPCRVVSGYYAAPNHVDPRTRHTPVTSEDVHFWVEVLAPGGTWTAIEPTPGYELMKPTLSLGARLTETLTRGWKVVRSNLPAIALGLVALASVVYWRRRLLDYGSTLSWWLLARGRARDRAIRTLRLVELRSSRAGLRRPPGRTPWRWYRSIASVAPIELRDEMERLLAIAGWARYAPEGSTPAPWSEIDINLACRQVARGWTLNRFRWLRRSFLAEEIES